MWTRLFFYNYVEYCELLGEYDFFYGAVVKNLKDRILFSGQINRNYFDPILAMHYWNGPNV